MFLSDRDLEYAVEGGDLIVDPRPAEYGPSDIDLRLAPIEEAKVWSTQAYTEAMVGLGGSLSVGFDNFNYKTFSDRFAVPVPRYDKDAKPDQKVYRDGERVILCPGGFFLWLTKENVGTPTDNARYICFINGK